MLLRWTIVFTALFIGSYAASAQPLKGSVGFIHFEEAGKEVTIKSKPKAKVLKLQSASQIVCRDKARTGTRIKKNRCKSVAAWNSEIRAERVRTYLINQ